MIEAYYAILGLEIGATAVEVNAAYRQLIQMCHPDRYASNPTLRQRAEEQSRRLNHARDAILADLAQGGHGGDEAGPCRSGGGWSQSTENPECEPRAGDSEAQEAPVRGDVRGVNIKGPLLHNSPRSHYRIDGHPIRFSVALVRLIFPTADGNPDWAGLVRFVEALDGDLHLINTPFCYALLEPGVALVLRWRSVQRPSGGYVVVCRGLDGSFCHIDDAAVSGARKRADSEFYISSGEARSQTIALGAARVSIEYAIPNVESDPAGREVIYRFLVAGPVEEVPQVVPMEPCKDQIRNDVPSLWTPEVACNWSLLFGGAFGAFVGAANWRVLGYEKEAEACRRRAWFYVVMQIFGLGLVTCLLWRFGPARRQMRHVWALPAPGYAKRSWGKPLGIASSIFAIPFLIGTVCELGRDVDRPNMSASVLRAPLQPVSASQEQPWTPGYAHPDEPHLLAGDQRGSWYPMPGFTWASPDDPEDLGVVSQPPGTPHPSIPHLILSVSPGVWEPAAGYTWQTDVPSDCRVKPLPPGTPHPLTPNVVVGDEPGTWAPAPGYIWRSDPRGDLVVVPALLAAPPQPATPGPESSSATQH